MLKRLPFDIEENKIKELDYIIEKLTLLGLLPESTTRTDVIRGLIKEFVKSNTKRLAQADVYEVNSPYRNQDRELQSSI